MGTAEKTEEMARLRKTKSVVFLKRESVERAGSDKGALQMESVDFQIRAVAQVAAG